MFLVTIKERNGDYESYHKWLVSEKKGGRETLEDFYGESSVGDEEGKAFWIHGEMLSYVYSTQEVTPEAYEILKKFL